MQPRVQDEKAECGRRGSLVATVNFPWGQESRGRQQGLEDQMRACCHSQHKQRSVEEGLATEGRRGLDGVALKVKASQGSSNLHLECHREE